MVYYRMCKWNGYTAYVLVLGGRFRSCSSRVRMSFDVALVVFTPWTSVSGVVCSYWSPSYRVVGPFQKKRIRGTYSSYYVNRSVTVSNLYYSRFTGSRRMYVFCSWEISWEISWLLARAVVGPAAERTVLN